MHAVVVGSDQRWGSPVEFELKFEKKIVLLEVIVAVVIERAITNTLYR